MALPDPAKLRRVANQAAVKVARKVLNITPEDPGEFRKVPDDLPRDSLFQQPLQLSVSTPDPQTQDDDSVEVTFRVVVRDAVGRRCPDLNVEATIAGPERTATGETTTDLMGAARFKMAGPKGAYTYTVLDVAGGSLTFEVADGPTTIDA